MAQIEWHWYHCVSHTYGTWLHGDPRGFRTRHHREHIEGDYKSPPPAGLYESRYKAVVESMTDDPIYLEPQWRQIIGQAVVDKLIKFGAQVLCASMGDTHVHVLAKMPVDPKPRVWMGHAKRHANFIGKEQGWVGKLWAVRGKEDRIRDRQHQLNTFNYVLAHAKEGAWVWDFRCQKDPRTPSVGLGSYS